jgi:hypothetical protein
MKKIRWEKFNMFVLFLLFVLIILLTILIFSNPMRRPKTWIKNDVLKLTPIGMNMEDVINVIIKKEEWKNYNINNQFGYVKDEVKNNSEKIFVGEKSITVFWGKYNTVFIFPMATHVTIFWGFDEDLKLIDVYIKKTIDVI